MSDKLIWKDQTLLQKRIIIITVAVTVILVIIAIIFYQVLGKESYFFMKLGQLLVLPITFLVFATGFSLRDATEPGKWKNLRIARCVVFAIAPVWYLMTCDWQQEGDALAVASADSPELFRYWGATHASLIGFVVCVAIIGILTAILKMKELTLQEPRVGDIDLH